MVVQRPWGGGTVLAHSGSNTMWYCVVWMAPKRNFAVLSATNIGGDEAAERLR
jgi:lipoate-protein ligase A